MRPIRFTLTTPTGEVFQTWWHHHKTGKEFGAFWRSTGLPEGLDCLFLAIHCQMILMPRELRYESDLAGYKLTMEIGVKESSVISIPA
jgi:hypothetical protein